MEDLREEDAVPYTPQPEQPLDRPLLRSSPKRLSAQHWGSGRAIWEVDLDGRQPEAEVRIGKVPASDETARQLDIAVGEFVWRRERRYLVDGNPVQRAVSHIPADLAEGTAITQADTGAGGIYSRLAEIGHAPVRFVEAIQCRMPEIEDTESLALSTNTPVIVITRIAYDANERPVEVNDMTLNASRYLLEYAFPA